MISDKAPALHLPGVSIFVFTCSLSDKCCSKRISFLSEFADDLQEARHVVASRRAASLRLPAKLLPNNVYSPATTTSTLVVTATSVTCFIAFLTLLDY